MIKFRLHCGSRIEAVEVERETEHYVYIKRMVDTTAPILYPGQAREPSVLKEVESRHAKSSDFENYFNTFQEAKDYGVGQLKGRLGKLNFERARVVKELEKLENLALGE